MEKKQKPETNLSNEKYNLKEMNLFSEILYGLKKKGENTNDQFDDQLKFYLCRIESNKIERLSYRNTLRSSEAFVVKPSTFWVSIVSRN